MKKPLFLILIAVSLLWTIGEAAYRGGCGKPLLVRRPPALTVPGTVYTMAGSNQYHAALCRFVDSSAVAMPQKRAEQAGLKPCLKCGG